MTYSLAPNNTYMNLLLNFGDNFVFLRSMFRRLNFSKLSCLKLNKANFKQYETFCIVLKYDNLQCFLYLIKIQ